jgi:lipopolysaccharide transport system ATP-binding protein
MYAVRSKGLWKYYRLRESKKRQLRDALTELLGGAPPMREFWALRDVTLDIPKAEALGLIGDNGAGKSTLLKIIAGVTDPTKGSAEVRGRVGALIDVGAGMHPDLTGRENIYLYGAIIGLRRGEIRHRFDEIVQFSGLEEFLEVPVKRYSSGMKVRLGFAVTAHLDPDILLVDEVLAVGDVAFQRRCIDRIRALQREGTTIVFVSHDLGSVERLCHRTVWIREGQMQDVGPSSLVVQHYRESVEREFVAAARGGVEGSGGFEVERVVLTDLRGRERFEFEPGEGLVVNLHYRMHDGRLAPEISFKIVDGSQTTLAIAHSNTQASDAALARRHGVVQCAFETLPLTPKTYQVWGQVLRLPDFREEVVWQPMAAFAVAETRSGGAAAAAPAHTWDVPILNVPTRWVLNGPAATDGQDRGEAAGSLGGRRPGGVAAGDSAGGPGEIPVAPTTVAAAQASPAVDGGAGADGAAERPAPALSEKSVPARSGGLAIWILMLLGAGVGLILAFLR